MHIDDSDEVGTETPDRVPPPAADSSLHKPFLKWPGGKIRVVPTLRELLPPGARLVEPFVGSGAVFLNVDYPRYLLADSNPDLINIFEFVTREGDAFFEFCRPWFSPAFHQGNVYYAMRELFNATCDPRLRAALFLYLNKHCFNGLVRYNGRGEFNSPFGELKQPHLPEDALRYFHRHAQRAEMVCQDFVATMQLAQAGDVVYCDPPYVPLSKTASFTKFARDGFGQAEHEELARQARMLAARGIPVVISNHDTPFVREVYAGAALHPISVRRSISRDGATRGTAEEIVAVFAAG